MLIHLHVKNLALIEEAEVDFRSGLNVLTGETGAGKSILLGSMQLILGSRVSKNLIRTNASYGLVELLFQVDDEETVSRLQDLDIEPEEGQVVLSRKIMEGKSINRINGESCTVSRMKAAAGLLLDIHGQHEHQSLLDQERQLEILDAYGKEEILPAREETSAAFRLYRKCCADIKALDIDQAQRSREIAFLEFEIAEIDHASLSPGEDEELEQKFKRMTNSKKIMEVLNQVMQQSGGGESLGASASVSEGCRLLRQISDLDTELKPLSDSLEQIDSLLGDFLRECSAYLDDLSFDEEDFYEVSQRLDLLNNLKAKYGGSIPEILHYREEQMKRLDDLLSHEERLAALKEEHAQARKKLDLASRTLSEIRRKYALALENQVIEGLKDLNFLKVQFSIEFSRKKTYTENGFDDVVYQISTNPGESLKPLGEIVSGGELSRIMLAIKAILADRDHIGTLIFDEIDTGISGRTAQKVSEKMAYIGQHHQVLCITHLPQIAAMADAHFEIRKEAEGGTTVTKIQSLDEEASVRELARLLSGAQLTEAVIGNAREMKRLAVLQKENWKKN